MRTKHSFRFGFSLVEVTLALGIAAFCLVAIFGLLPVGLNSNRAAIEQTAAAGVAQAIIADLRATQNSNPSTATSKLFYIPVPAVSASKTMTTIYLREDGSVAQAGNPPTTVNLDADASQNPRYRATLSFYPPAAGGTVSSIQLLITWPAMADPKASEPPSKFSGVFEAVTALKRN